MRYSRRILEWHCSLVKHYAIYTLFPNNRSISLIFSSYASCRRWKDTHISESASLVSGERHASMKRVSGVGAGVGIGTSTINLVPPDFSFCTSQGLVSIFIPYILERFFSAGRRLPRAFLNGTPPDRSSRPRLPSCIVTSKYIILLWKEKSDDIIGLACLFSFRVSTISLSGQEVSEVHFEHLASLRQMLLVDVRAAFSATSKCIKTPIWISSPSIFVGQKTRLNENSCNF